MGLLVIAGAHLALSRLLFPMKYGIYSGEKGCFVGSVKHGAVTVVFQFKRKL